MVRRVMGVGIDDGPDTGQFPLPEIVLSQLLTMLDGRYAAKGSGGGGGGGGGSVDYGNGIFRQCAAQAVVTDGVPYTMQLPNKMTYAVHDGDDVTWDDPTSTATINNSGLYYVASGTAYMANTTDAVDIGVRVEVTNGISVGPDLSAWYFKLAGPDDFPSATLSAIAMLPAGCQLTPKIEAYGAGFTSTGGEQLRIVRVG